MPAISWENPEERLRIYQVLGPKRHLIDTLNISYNNVIGPNNNTAVLLYKGFYEDPIIEELN